MKIWEAAAAEILFPHVRRLAQSIQKSSPDACKSHHSHLTWLTLCFINHICWCRDYWHSGCQVTIHCIRRGKKRQKINECASEMRDGIKEDRIVASFPFAFPGTIKLCSAKPVHWCLLSCSLCHTLVTVSHLIGYICSHFLSLPPNHGTKSVPPFVQLLSQGLRHPAITEFDQRK
jgi:hypothetical protein